MSYTLHFTETTVRDLNEAEAYIDHVLLNPDATDALLDKLDNELQRLTDYPQSHPVIDDPILKAQYIRFIAVNHYLAFYTIDETRHLVYILRFLYGKRDWISVIKQGYSTE